MRSRVVCSFGGSQVVQGRGSAIAGKIHKQPVTAATNIFEAYDMSDRTRLRGLLVNGLLRRGGYCCNQSLLFECDRQKWA
jgi:hypothetical protein